MQITKTKLAGLVLAVALSAFSVGVVAQGRYPEINRAEGALNGALGDLQRARDVFGGHKTTAERLISQAVGELEAAKGFAASHGM